MTDVGQVVDRNPIINDPFHEPQHYWHFGEVEPELRDGRRTAGYLPPAHKSDGTLRITDDIIPLQLVNDLRERVKAWRNNGYQGATALTQELFEFWFDDERSASNTRPFFCQQEAIETIAFLTEAAPHHRVGIHIPKTEAYDRWAVKMATGSGKTIVMAMVITWAGLNKLTNRQDARFTDSFLVVCPNLTVKERLSGVEGLQPSHPESAFVMYDLVPRHLSGLLGALRVLVTNWHALAPSTDPKRGVVQRGSESDSAFCRRVLEVLGTKHRLMVFNDEAHHAWRMPAGLKIGRDNKDEVEEATVWVGGLERVHRDREILRCLDFSATPMYPSTFGTKAWTPFEWVISDFALVDAIESGLVKVPRVPTDDNAGRAIPKYRNLWEHIKGRLPKDSEGGNEHHPLLDYLAEADGPLKQLAGAWESTFERWEKAGRPIPPAMIVVCNNTAMAKLLERHIAVLGEASPALVNPISGTPRTVRIDSTVIAAAERRDEAVDGDPAEALRTLVGTVGKRDKPGEQVRCVISVQMLSEGWSANNVTQILGLRAFQSQLLCEQVIGRGLRRSDYSDLSRPEYVDIYGVPFQLLPFARGQSGEPSEPPNITTVRTVPERSALRLEFPRVVQVVHDVGDTLEVDLDAIEPVSVSAEFDPTATYVEFETGSPRGGMGGETQNRQRAYENFRIQRMMYRVAARLVAPFDRPWLFPQALAIVEQVVAERVIFVGDVDPRELCNLRYLNILVERIGDSLRPGLDRSGALLPVLDEYEPIGSTDGIAFATTKPCAVTTKSHISHAVCDSKLERGIVAVLEVEAVSYAKNDRLFLEIPYRHLGRTHRYRPDFIVQLVGGLRVLVEGKGRADEKDASKATAARRWVSAVNAWGQLGRWEYCVCYDPAALPALLDQVGADPMATAM